MSVSRANLLGGPASVTWNSVRFFTKSDIVSDMEPTLKEIETSMYGPVDKRISDRVIKISLDLWGAWENLSVLFPSSVLSPVVGTRIFGTTDLPLVIEAKNGDRITFKNAQLTKLPDVFLGVDGTIYASAAEFTCLLANSTQPEAANAYFTVDTASYVEATALFAKTNFKAGRASAAWGAVTGFTAFQAQKGWNIGWQLGLEPDVIDGCGTVDMVLQSFVAQAKCMPLEPTNAQIETNSLFQGTTLGSLISAGAHDLVITSAASPVVTLKNACLVKNGYRFGSKPLRVGELVWETTRGFTTGAPNAIATVA